MSNHYASCVVGVFEPDEVEFLQEISLLQTHTHTRTNVQHNHCDHQEQLQQITHRSHKSTRTLSGRKKHKIPFW